MRATEVTTAPALSRALSFSRTVRSPRKRDVLLSKIHSVRSPSCAGEGHTGAAGGGHGLGETSTPGIRAAAR
jgi:hypothetical protein